jgi:hypothetical protein
MALRHCDSAATKAPAAALSPVRRFLPPAETFAGLQIVTIVDGDRLDNLAARYLGDPEQSWRLCDANRAMQPEALVAYVGATLAITLPEGVPGAGDAG